ncbi:P-loop containing nucleoside triphosphate hydrolase protein [Athelia psychrophila]|uniref:P-loop containing nucleoside triphosphate hydrolase protein n=1 Tax=Athelia psychrophila TaxID=1759441 RepID=A0A167W859_9AGAM|nr:P-loop containing nucleoside triphosphate hydrolase protein [Fibularhizoctonia sp. CBS 109695]
MDAATVEPGDGDVSVDNIDEALLRGSSSSNARDQDKVLVSIRQIASGETFTLSGDPDEPGIIPRADAGPGVPPALQLPGDIQRGGPRPSRHVRGRAAGADPGNGALASLRDEVVTRLAGVRAMPTREEGNRRRTNTNWNKRSSRSHIVFRMAMESRERGLEARMSAASPLPERAIIPIDPGSGRKQASDGRRELSLIDLAGSERVTSDMDRTREGKYINTSLLTLGSIIGTQGKTYVHSFIFTFNWLLQPSLSGNTRISVIASLNPSPSAITESTSTLLFTWRIKRTAPKAEKKEETLVEENESGDEDGEVAVMLDHSPVEMAIEMNMRMQVGSSLLQNEWSVVEEYGEADMSFEHQAPTPHGLSKLSERLGMGSSNLD